MNNLDWTLVTFLIIISGIIAFVGNYVGRRAGKRRISILGIRPYYTSMIITVLTGIIITVVTLVILTSVSSSIRSALENKSQLQETIKLLSQRLSTTQSELSIRASELNAAIEYQKKLEKKINEKDEKVKALEKRLKEMESEITSREVALKNREIALEESKANLEELDKQRQKLTNIISELNKDREKLKKESELLRKEKERLIEESKQLKDKLTILEREISILEEQKKILSNKLELYSSELSELKKEVSDYKAQAIELKKEIKNKEEQLNLLRNQRIIFYGGEIILAETVNGPKSEQEARDSLNYLLDRANEIIKSRHSQLGVYLSDGRDNIISTYDLNELDFAIKSLKEEQRLIRIRVKNNTLIREPVQLVIESLRSKLIFNKDETIVFKFISSKLPRSKIIEELDLLLNEAKKEGMRRGMIVDHLTNPITNVSYETLLSLSVRIKVKYSKIGSVLVLVKAERDIYTGGPLRVKFELR
ncbi:MAG: DUF3084 domain-containing protein [bacterium]|nr:DUF3084 domain-containing protein [bacterium]